MSSLMKSIKEKLLHYVKFIKWADIEKNFMDVKKVKDMGNSKIKACKALCFGLQVFFQDTNFDTFKKLSKISQMAKFLRSNQFKLCNLDQIVANAVELSQFDFQI